MLKFKDSYRNQTLAFTDGTLINADNIKSKHSQKRLKEAPSLAYMFEEADPPVTGGGGGGAGDPPKKRTVKK